MPASAAVAASNPLNVIPGAASAVAAVLAHVPTCPGRLHCCSGWSQAVSQQTPSVQLPDKH